MPTNESSSNQNLRSESKEKPQFVINASEKNDMNALRSDVNELSNGVKTAIGDLKKSIADIRSSVSEMENPFNVLRTVNADSEKINAEKLPPGVKSIVLGNPEENTLDENELAQQKPEPTPKIEEIIPKKPTITPSSIAPAQPIKASAYLDWIWELLDDGLTAENIRQLANLCEMTNYLPKQANEFIYSLAVTAEKIRLIGFTKGHLLLFMYKAASLSKANIDPEDMKALLDITEKQLKNQKDE